MFTNNDEITDRIDKDSEYYDEYEYYYEDEDSYSAASSISYPNYPENYPEYDPKNYPENYPEYNPKLAFYDYVFPKTLKHFQNFEGN